MTKRMDWTKLLSTKRVSEFDTCQSSPKASQFIEARSPFERDYDQIMFSYPFRRLQDKTQVIPFPKYDFVHTRLTHSLEVASIGRSLGSMAGELILEKPKENIKGFNKSDFGTLVAAACLAHDIGNPPFGHSGEDAISLYFSRSRAVENYNKGENEWWMEDLVTSDLIDILNNSVEPNSDIKILAKNDISAERLKLWNDLSNFEGNANGFRILTDSCEKGINPTAALLGTFTKYPRESFLYRDPYRDSGVKTPKSQSKYGFFQDDRKIFKSIAEELGLIKIKEIGEEDIAYRRHPLVFLMEAADDIAYRIMDFEDGLRHGLIDFEKKYDHLSFRNKNNDLERKEIKASPRNLLCNIACVDDSFCKKRLEEYKLEDEKISYLRTKVITVLIHKCFSVFKNEYENIMTGKFDSALLDEILDEDIKENLEKVEALVRKYVYHYRPVLECEASGFEIMEYLIKSFSAGVDLCYSCGHIESAKDRKLRSLVPQELQPGQEQNDGMLTTEEKYQRTLNILGYIAGMTDNYATRIFRNISGITVWR